MKSLPHATVHVLETLHIDIRKFMDSLKPSDQDRQTQGSCWQEARVPGEAHVSNHFRRN